MGILDMLSKLGIVRSGSWKNASKKGYRRDDVDFEDDTPGSVIDRDGDQPENDDSSGDFDGD